MALVVKDRVQETTTTTGTGTVTLAGAVTGFQSFSVIGNGNTTYYSITGGAEWEIGIGTYTASGTTLSRDTVLESSNSGSLVNFSAGSKTVFCTYPAERSMYVDGTTITPATTATLPITSGGTGSSTATFSGANITSLNASSVSSGTLGAAYGGTGQSSLTANNVILGNGTSAVQFVAPGTSANVLTSNGTSWVSQAAGGGGGDWTLVASTTIASGSSTSVDMTGIPTTQGSYWLIGRVFFNTDTGVGAINNWAIRFSTDNGASFIASTNAYAQVSAGTSFSLWNSSFGSDVPCTLDFFAHMIQSDGSTVGTAIQGSVWRAYSYTGTLASGTGTSQVSQQGGNLQSTAAAVNALRLLRISGGKTMSGGYLRLYKIKFS